jgi:hypothetical protein
MSVHVHVPPVSEPPCDVVEHDPHPLPRHLLYPAVQKRSDPWAALKVQVQEVVDPFLLKSNKNKVQSKQEQNKPNISMTYMPYATDGISYRKKNRKP